jgi:hypothetical protein
MAFNVTIINSLGIFNNEPGWLVESLMQAVARLPKLNELDVQILYAYKYHMPFGLFANLSKLSVTCHPRKDVPFFISQMATVIANSPQLRSLSVACRGLTGSVRLPTLGELFAKLSSENPLPLEHLHIDHMDATVDQVTLRHLTRLDSFYFEIDERRISVAQSVWTSFLVNHVKLSDVEINGIMTEETVSYLLSFSGLKRIAMDVNDYSTTSEDIRKMFLTDVLPKHVDSLQTLKIMDDCESEWVKLPCYTFHVTF